MELEDEWIRDMLDRHKGRWTDCYGITNLCKFESSPDSCNMVLSSSLPTYRSSRPEVFYKKGVLRNFAKFTRKHLCHSLFFNKVAGLRPATLLKKRLWHSCFPVNFAKFLRTPFFLEHFWWLLLHMGATKATNESVW